MSEQFSPIEREPGPTTENEHRWAAAYGRACDEIKRLRAERDYYRRRWAFQATRVPAWMFDRAAQVAFLTETFQRLQERDRA